MQWPADKGRWPASQIDFECVCKVRFHLSFVIRDGEVMFCSEIEHPKGKEEKNWGI